MFELIGFASLNGGTTGGAGGSIIDVSTDTQLADALQGDDTPAIVIVHGQIDVSGSISVKSNKTVKSLGDGWIRYGRLNISNAENVIVTNLRMSEATDDSINIEYSNNIWIHRNTLENGYDGLCDVKHGSNYVTISWNHFRNHDKTMLIGHDDANGSVDIGKLKTTIHHNWMENCNQRTPMVRFAEVHSFNNYISDTVNGTRVGVGARIYQEKNYFDRANRPFSYNVTEDGWIKDVGSKFVDTITTEEDRKTDRPSGVTWEPSSYYAYTAQDPDDVKIDVMANAGIYTEEETTTSHPITLTNQQYICPANAVNSDNVGKVHHLWSYVEFSNEYQGTSYTDSSFSFTKVSGSGAFGVNATTGELTVIDISLFTEDATITVRVSVGGDYMDTVCTILYVPVVDCVYFDSTYDGSNGTSNGTRSRPYLKYSGSGLGNGTPGKGYFFKRGTITTQENIIFINPMNGAAYPLYMRVGAWGQGTKPIFDVTNCPTGRAIDVGAVAWGDGAINYSLEANNVSIYDLEFIQDSIELPNYSILVKPVGDNIDLRRSKFTNTNFDHGHVYLVTSEPAGNGLRNITLQSLEVYNSNHRGIKIETSGVTGENFLCENTVATLEHPVPNFAHRPFNTLKYIRAKVVSTATGNLGLGIRASYHNYHFAYLENFNANPLQVWVHNANDHGLHPELGPEHYIDSTSGYHDIILKNCGISVAFGRHAGTTDFPDGVKIERIKAIGCAQGIEVSFGATNTLIQGCDISGTGNDGLRIYGSTSTAGPGTKVYNSKFIGNSSNDVEISRDGTGMEIKNCQYSSIVGSADVMSNNTDSVLREDLEGMGIPIECYDVDITGIPVANPPSIGPYEFVEVEPTTFTVTASVDPISSGSVSGSGEYVDDSVAELEATPATGYTFEGWYENDILVSTDNPYSFTVTTDRNLVALFEVIPTTTYEISVTAGVGGSVSGSGTYDEFETASIEATPDTGYLFSHWEESGLEVSSINPYEFTVTEDRSFIAIFDLMPIPTVITVRGRFVIV